MDLGKLDVKSGTQREMQGTVYKPRWRDVAGQRFGKLQALWPAGRTWTVKCRQEHLWWACQCDCGTVKVAKISSLLAGITTKCGRWCA